ncbi:galanin receptor 2b-like [Diadema antillarum]|uniref:galanin receptor 2b-like n=1 Tax=Diadema antillarum TaxID=105358 RepID=UPI003A84CF9A
MPTELEITPPLAHKPNDDCQRQKPPRQNIVTRGDKEVAQTKSCTATVLALIWIVSLLSQSPPAIFADIVNGHICVESWPSSQAHRAFKTSLFVFFYLLPLAVICLCYARTAAVLWNAGAEFVSPYMTGAPRRRHSRRKVARMVMILVTCFTVCWLPYHIRNIMECWHLIFYSEFSYYTTILVRVMAYANSCLNPLLYSCLCENFRKNYYQACSCCCRKRDPQYKTQLICCHEMYPNGTAAISEHTPNTNSTRMSAVRKSFTSSGARVS